MYPFTGNNIHQASQNTLDVTVNSGSTKRLGIYYACQFDGPSSIVNGVEILRICKLSIYKVDQGLNQWRYYDKVLLHKVISKR